MFNVSWTYEIELLVELRDGVVVEDARRLLANFLFAIAGRQTVDEVHEAAQRRLFALVLLFGEGSESADVPQQAQRSHRLLIARYLLYTNQSQSPF